MIREKHRRGRKWGEHVLMQSGVAREDFPNKVTFEQKGKEGISYMEGELPKQREQQGQRP